jgi:hypothetical protein
MGWMDDLLVHVRIGCPVFPGCRGGAYWRTIVKIGQKSHKYLFYKVKHDSLTRFSF